MKIKKGQNIVEICIISAVVVVVGIIAYTALGDQINQLFSSSQKKFKDFNPFNVSDSTGTIDVPTPSTPAVEPGTLGGSFDQPQQSCSDSTCSIDFGDFVLTGIPDNFQTIVTASGTSGGTEVLANLVEQIVSQADKVDPPLDSSLIQQLAGQGHAIANAQKAIDSAITGGGCVSSNVSDVAACIGQSGGANTGANETLKIFTGTLQKIQSTYPTPSPEQQNVIKTVEYLAQQITTAQNSLSGKITQLQSLSSGLTEENVKNGTISAQYNYLNLSSAGYSSGTHVKSGIICATGHGDDTGTSCTP